MSEREIVEFVFEYWDCPKCGRKAVRGDRDKCPECGTIRDDSITFYRKELDEVITDEKQIAEMTQGPDWICSFCGTMNSQSENQCEGCGSSKDASNKNYFDILERKRGEKGTPEEAESDISQKGNSSNGKSKKGLAIAAGIALVLGGLYFWTTSTSKVIYRVTSVSWERSIAKERYTQGVRTAWHDEMTGENIQVLSRNREIRKYEKRQTGTRSETYSEDERYQSGTKEKCTTSYKSTGSGAAKKVTKCVDVPVYKTRKVTKTRMVPLYKDVPLWDQKVTYRAKYYAVYSTASINGMNNKPKWPRVTLNTGLDGKPDREGEKTEKYIVTAVKSDKKKKGPRKVIINTNEKRFTTVYIKGADIPLAITNTGSVKLSKEDTVIEK